MHPAFALPRRHCSSRGHALLCRRENGNRVLDAVELDDAGLALRAHAYYEQEQT